MMAKELDAADKMEEKITCPVCHEHFRDPKILPCLHYYCKECVRQLALQAGPNCPFACPECRRRIVLSQNDPDQLCTAFFVNRMKEVHARMEKAQGKVEAICDMCSGAKAEAFCRQCTDFICKDCVRSHGVMKVFAGHKIVTIQELKVRDKEILLKEPSPAMCKGHNEQVKIFCFDCDSLICRDCIFCDHVGHKFEFVNKSAPQYKKVIKQRLVKLMKIQANITAATREVEKVEREVSEQHKAVTDTVEQSFKQLHEILCMREKELLDRASELKLEKLDILGAQKKVFALATKDIKSLVEFVEHTTENATDEEFMSLQQKIQKQIQEQCQQFECIDLAPVDAANVDVRIACAEDIVALCQRNADVIVLPADPTKCTAEGPGTKVAEVAKSAQFTVHTMHQNGQLCVEKQVVEAELKSVVNDSVIYAKVISKVRGNYKVSYTPEIRGRHSLIVKVNGEQIAGSPFQVFAKIEPTQLGNQVKVVEKLSIPMVVALNSVPLQVSEWGGKEVMVLKRNGKKVQPITVGRSLVIPSSSSLALHASSAVAVDKDYNTYVSNGPSLFKFSKEGKLLNEIQRKDSQPGEFIKIINDKLYMCDCGNHTVQILTTELEYSGGFGCHGDGNGQFNEPNGIAQDREGNLYVTDSHNNRVQVFDCKGQFLFTFSEKDAASKQLIHPNSICVGPDQLVYVCDHGNKCVSVFKTNGEFVTSFGQFTNLSAIVIDDDGFIYVGECRRFSLRGTIMVYCL